MGDRSNVSHRVLNAVRHVTGSAGSLENFIGLALVDGAQCFVTEEEANYRWLAKSTLVADGRFVVKASGPNEQGRWVREPGLVGFAMLEDGNAVVAASQGLIFGDYEHKQLVQFEMADSVTLVYHGAVSRLAMLFAKARLDFDRSSLSLRIRLDQNNTTGYVASQRIERAGSASVAGSALIVPGARLSLHATGPADSPLPEPAGGAGSLRVVLV